ncbi:MAG: tRNA (adenosine(37)-N6)-dimethylallyltransferase MiaA [Bacteroidota bacterium]
MKYLISIVGPTGVGKTELSLRLARHFQTEVLSGDSRQVYRHMNIGTAKVSPEITAEIPHHFIDILDPSEEFDAAQFAEQADQLVERLHASGREVVIVVGGSTLYMNALWHGLDDMPKVPKEIRTQLNQELSTLGLPELVNQLKAHDPTTWERIDKHNPARVIRALEVFRASGKPISFFRENKPEKTVPYRHIKVGLTTERSVLYERINHRVLQMMEAGLLQEVDTLLNMGYTSISPGLRSIGYQELIAFRAGKHSLETAIKLIQRNSRRYAKRQLTWYRKEADIVWMESGTETAENVKKWVEIGYPYKKSTD